METVTLHFSPIHAKKMLSGKGVCQLDGAHLRGEKGHPLEVQVKRATANKLKKAAKAGKSVRVRMDELHDGVGGTGIADFFRKVKEGFQKAGKFLKEKVIDTDLYQQQIKPKVRQGLEAAIKQFVPAAAQPIAQKGLEFVGEKTGAAGVYAVPVYGGAMMPMGVYYPQPYSNWSTMAMPLAPAMMSKPVWPGFGLPAGVQGGEPIEPTRGSGFRVV